uniref:Uncharacterized protein n=2 Tax=Heterosigma akashiwo TaxID=2829 RepID=A0A7S3XZ55_HETAK
MHPDQATDAIVAQGLLHRKPFAVVPCCVFPESNPHRVLEDDEKNRRSRGGGGGGGGGARASPRRVVRTHEDLCCYLQGQSDAVRRDTLLMEGRNVVLFFKPKVL